MSQQKPERGPGEAGGCDWTAEVGSLLEQVVPVFVLKIEFVAFNIPLVDFPAHILPCVARAALLNPSVLRCV